MLKWSYFIEVFTSAHPTHFNSEELSKLKFENQHFTIMLMFTKMLALVIAMVDIYSVR